MTEKQQNEPLKIRGPWRITDTVHHDRKNLFCLAPEHEHHIGTIVSGSLSKLERFEASLAVIRVAPEMFVQLKRTLDLLKTCGNHIDNNISSHILEIEALLDRAQAEFIEG